MKEVVSEIVAAEKKVAEMLAEARRKATLIRQESEKEVSAIVGTAQNEAQCIIREAVAAAQKEAESIRQKAFFKVENENRLLKEGSLNKIESVVDEIVSFITTCELPAAED